MKLFSVCLAAAVLAPVSVQASTTFNLGVASPFALFAGSGMVNTGPTNVYGNVGIYPGGTMAGFPAGFMSGGSIYLGGNAISAHDALATAFSQAGQAPCGMNLSGRDLAGMTLTSGVYCFDSSAFLGGTVTLDGRGDPNAQFVFLMNHTLTTGINSSVVFTNGASGSGVLWLAVDSVNIGAGSSFAGSLISIGNVTLNAGASLQCGSAFSLNGFVNLDSNRISTCGSLAPPPPPPPDPILNPEPSTASMVLLIGVPALLLVRRYKKSKTAPTSVV